MPRRSSCYVSDITALIALRADEPGAALVADLIHEAGRGGASCVICFMALMEIFYCMWRVEGGLKGEAAYKLCLSLPIEIIHEPAELLAHAARIKAENRLSLADSWIAAIAQIEECRAGAQRPGVFLSVVEAERVAAQNRKR
jgi:predicted nucleic acid-binding protein